MGTKVPFRCCCACKSLSCDPRPFRTPACEFQSGRFHPFRHQSPPLPPHPPWLIDSCISYMDWWNDWWSEHNNSFSLVWFQRHHLYGSWLLFEITSVILSNYTASQTSKATLCACMYVAALVTVCTYIILSLDMWILNIQTDIVCKLQLLYGSLSFHCSV